METLNEEQTRVARKILGKGFGNRPENTFVTGAAGTGKSYLLKVLVQEFRKIFPPEKVAVTAMTGVAAVNIDGITLHKFAGMGHDLTRPLSYPARKRWRDTRVLIIDEVSMLTKTFLEKIAELIHDDLQVVCFGDFLQLPPVGDEPCFVSDAWKTLGFEKNTIVLRTVVRQTDQEFVRVLHEIRDGTLSDESLAYLDTLDVANKACPDREVTKLYALNRDVDSENAEHLNKLDAPEVTFEAKDTYTERGRRSSPGAAGAATKAKIERQAPRVVLLKEGARVMLTRNTTSVLVNGSMGVVDAIRNGVPYVKFDHDPETSVAVPPIEYEEKHKKTYCYTRTQVPLKLAWALTIHKSQGLTLTNVKATLHGAFERGQIYTVLSRVKDPKGLYIDDVEHLVHRNKVCPDAKAYYDLNLNTIVT